MAPTFVPLFVLTLEVLVTPGPLVEFPVLLGMELVPPLLNTLLIGFGNSSGSPDQNL